MGELDISPNSHRQCLNCDGRGFTRSGDFYSRAFPKCTICKGVGQFYLEPVPEREQPKKK